MQRLTIFQQHLQDQRSGHVIFLSHCILNEITRYLGGACRAGCIAEIVQVCIEQGQGIVQLPCPEQHAWGGILKPYLLMAYGSRHTLLYRLRRLLLPIFVWYTRHVYRKLARATAAQIQDYLDSGFSVVSIVGIDGSRSCGVTKTLDLEKSFELTAQLDPTLFTVEALNNAIRAALVPGRGLFTAELQQQLQRRGLNVEFTQHDLIAELDRL